MDKVLSIIIAAYNVEAYLDDALRSCVIEDCELQKNYEVIIVNDGSRDRTAAIARDYAYRYPEVFRVIDKPNGGYGSVINEGIRAAKGKYFKLLDGDDWYDSQTLAKMVQNLLGCDSDMVLTDYTEVCEDGRNRKVHQYGSLKEREQFPAMELQDVAEQLAMHGICYKTSILRKIPVPVPEHCFYTDNEYVIYGASYAKTVIYYPIDLYQYRIGREGQSVSIAGLKRHIDDFTKVISDVDTFYDLLQETENRKLAERLIVLIYCGYIHRLLFLPGSREVRQKLETFIERVKSLYPERYCQMENKKIRILRATKYKAYGLCRLYYKWERLRDRA